MSDRAFPNSKLMVSMIVAIACLIILVLYVLMEVNPSVEAQDNKMNFHSLLLRMNEMHSNDSGFTFIVTFLSPLIKDESAWIIGDPNDQYRRTVDEIGEDYVCFREHGGGEDFVRCTPFSNILQISYLET